ncbi:DUF2892 domain-containing protein [Streptococcus orisratti]|uniref:DUF2892 domain-containing protein n=1 Tax=Streptococcus TaxID=1301 RepID=UPI002B08272F|nr:DUF2892 domain-containing protein [Streptococcus suis]
MQITKEIEKQFAVSVATPWIKGKMDVDNHNVMIDIPNTVLFGLIPAGRRKHTTPLGNISNVYTSSSYKLGRMVGGLLLCLLGFSMFGESFLGGLITLAIGGLIIASGIITVFRYENNGRSVTIPLPFFEAHHAQDFADKVIAQINKYNDDRNGFINAQLNAQLINNQQAQSAQQIVDALSNQRK